MIEPVVEEQITLRNEHAVRCSTFAKPACILEYIKSISNLIGASHILAVFEDKDFIKVFLDDKLYVETLIKSCLHVMGRHITVDYFKPPGTKLVLSNVDPIIANYDIMRLLSIYGTIVSPVICPPISDDIELCHIAYGVRYVYMNLNGCIPDRLEFKYGDELCNIKILIVESQDPITLPSIKVDEDENRDQTMNEEVTSNSSIESLDTIVGPSKKCLPDPNISEPPVLVSIESVSSESNSRINCVIKNQHSSPQLNSAQSVKARKKRMISKISSTRRAARRIKNNVKHKYLIRRIKKAKSSHKPYSKRITAINQGSYCEDADFSSTGSALRSIDDVCLENSTNECINEVLDKEQLNMYLHEVKGNRAPLELARKYIGNDCDNDKINQFMVQLMNYRKNLTEINLKNRIYRLINSVKEALDIESSFKED